MEQEVKDWEKYSRQIVLAMSKRMAELGMTQQMLAEKMNCTQQYVSKVLKGQRICRWKHCARLKAHWELRYSSVLMILNKIALKL